VTASQVASYAFPHELPLLAQRPEVQVRFDLDEYPHRWDCGVCEERIGADPVPGDYAQITYRFRLDIEPSRVGICSAEHAEKELDDLLHHLTRVPAEIVLHVSADPSSVLPGKTPREPARTLPALVAFPDEDPNVKELLSLRQGIARMRSDSDDPFETIGFEAARERALAYVQAAVNDRIERLGRAAA